LLLDLFLNFSGNAPQAESALADDRPAERMRVSEKPTKWAAEPLRAMTANDVADVYHTDDGTTGKLAGFWFSDASRQVVQRIQTVPRVNGDRAGHVPVGPRPILDVLPSTQDGPSPWLTNGQRPHGHLRRVLQRCDRRVPTRAAITIL
jgi:hypothetical protein